MDEHHSQERKAKSFVPKRRGTFEVRSDDGTFCGSFGFTDAPGDKSATYKRAILRQAELSAKGVYTTIRLRNA